MKLIILHIILICTQIGLFSQPRSYNLIRVTDLKRALVSNNDNTLKLYDICIDETRKYAYTSGIVTENISAINLAAKTETHTIKIPFQEQIHTIKCNPNNGYLLLTTIESAPKKSYLIKPADGDVMGIIIHNSAVNGTAFHRSSNRIFISEGAEIKIYSGENLSLLSSINTMFEAGGIDLDTINNQLYVVSRNIISGYTVVKVYSANPPYNNIRIINIPSSHNTGEIIADAGRNRFYLIGLRNIKVINLTSGSIINQINFHTDFSSPVYDSNNGIIYLTDDDGYSSNSHNGLWSKIYKYNTISNVLDSFQMGDKTSRLGFYNGQSILALPNMHSGLVQLYNTANNNLDTIDVGESADDITAKNSNLVIVSRLGGRRIITQNLISGNLNWFKAGNSPCEAEFDQTRNRIYILNAFESSISVFNASNNTLITTINLPVNQTRTDAIPWMHYDNNLSKLFIAIPELNKIIAFNCNTNSAEATFTVPGFNFNQNVHKAPGILQTESASNSNRLYVFQRIEKKIKVFSAVNYNIIDSLDVSSWINENYGVFSSNIFYYDNVSNTIFIGNKAIDPVNYSIKGTIALGRKVLGYNQLRSILYTIDVKGDSVFVYENHPVNYSLLNIRFLYKTKNLIGPPVFKYDAVNNDLFITDFNYPIIKHYDLDSLSPIGLINESNNNSSDFEIIKIYPNPFNSSVNIKFKISNKSNLIIKLFDINGKETDIIYNKTASTGRYDINYNFRKNTASGVYFIRFEIDGIIKTIKAVYVK